MAKNERTNLIKNKMGSALLEKVIMVAFSVFMGGAIIVYSAGIIKQSKEVKIYSGAETSRIQYKGFYPENVSKLQMVKFVREASGVSLTDAKNAVESEQNFYWTREELVYGATKVTYAGGFEAIFNCANWQQYRVSFEVYDTANNGDILVYQGTEYNYTWEIPGTEVTKNEVAPNKFYSIELLSYGSNKIPAIKAVKALTGLGLKDSKDLVESCPCIITESSVGTAIKTFCDEVDAKGDIMYKIRVA